MTTSISRSPLRTEVGLRVAFADEDARLRFGEGVVEIAPEALLSRRTKGKHRPLVDVVVGHEQSLREHRGKSLVHAASPQHVVTLGSGRVEASRERGTLWTEPSISPAFFNPIGFRRDSTQNTVMARFADGAPPPGALDDLLRQRTGDRTHLDQIPSLVASPSDPQDAASIYDMLGAIDVPELHSDAYEQAIWILRLTASGVPVLARLAETTRELIGPELTRLVSESTLTDLTDRWRRDRLSVAQRGVTLRRHGSTHTWRRLASQLDLPVAPPVSVSVLLATNRPEDLLAAARRFAAFTYPNRELVIGLHGEGFPHDVSQQLRAVVEGPLTVLPMRSERTLGQVLNELTTAASGEVVSKMDDDDLYSATHLDDLLEALRYSGATLVGKGSEFVYLQEIDTTIRRLPNGAESRSRSIGGGTLMISRGDLRSIGGWQQAPRAVDQRLMDDVVAAGGQIHRTHGYGFVLMRRTDGHTWSSDVDYFLRQAVRQWPGLAIEEAGVA